MRCACLVTGYVRIYYAMMRQFSNCAELVGCLMTPALVCRERCQTKGVPCHSAAEFEKMLSETNPMR